MHLMRATRKPEMDGLRVVAIIMVIIWHYFSNQINAPDKSIWSYFIHCFDMFWSGVDLFFVLSGFLICGILLDAKGAKNYFQIFYLRRSLRIFPIYFITVFAFYLFTYFAAPSHKNFEWLVSDPMPFLSYITFTQNYLMGIHGDYGAHWLGMTWSLAVEEQFYLLLPFAIWFLPRKLLVFVFVAGIIISPAVRFLYPGFLSSVGLPWRMDSLLSGALAAIIFRSPKATTILDKNKIPFFIALSILLIGFGILTLKPLILGEKVFNIFKYTWLALLYSSILWIILRCYLPFFNCILKNKILIWSGMISFAVYMFHQPVSGIMHGLIYQRAPKITSIYELSITILSLLITILMAFLTYHTFEKKLIKKGHNFKYQF